MSMFYILLGLCLFGSTLASMAGPGPCPKVEAMSNFDLSKYMGKWYMVLGLFVPNVMIRQKCPFDELTLDTNGTVSVIRHIISRWDGSKSFQPHFLYTHDPAEPAKMTLVNITGHVQYDQYVLDTDYDNFTLVYTCIERNGDHSIQSFVFTREQFAQESVVEKIQQAIKKHNLPVAGYRIIKQDDCVMKPDKDFKPIRKM